MASPTYLTSTPPVIDPSTGGLNSDQGNFKTDGTNGNVTCAAATMSGTVLLSSKKLGASAAGDILDFSGAQGVLKLGPTSTTLKLNLQASAANLTDTNANNITSHSKFSGSTNTATAHNYAVATPNFVNAMVTGTATATSFGTFTATQVTPAMTSAAAYTGLASLE